MRSKTEIQKETEPFIQIFNSFVEALHPLLILQDSSNQEPLSHLSSMIEALQDNLKNLDQSNSEELKTLDEIFSSLIKDIQVEILWQVEDQIRNQPAATDLQEKLNKSKSPLAIHEFSSLVEAFKGYLNQNEKWLRDAKLIIKDGQQCIELFSELPQDFCNSISDIIKTIEDQIKKFEQVNLKDSSKLKDAHTKLSLLIRTAQSEMLMYFLKQAEANKALEYTEELKKYEILFSKNPLIRLKPETMSSLIKGFKEISLYAMPKKTEEIDTASSADVSDNDSSSRSKAKAPKRKRRHKKVVALIADAEQESPISERSRSLKASFLSYQEQIAEIDKSIAAVNQSLLELSTQSMGEDRKSPPNKIKKIQTLIDKLNKERTPYKLYLTSYLDDLYRKPTEEERNDTGESIFLQLGNRLKSVLPILPLQPETLSNLPKLLDSTKSVSDVKREFEAFDMGTTLRALITKESEYLENLTQLVDEIKYQDIFSTDRAVKAKYEEKYRAICEKNAKLVAAAESYNSLFERKISLTKAQEEKAKVLDEKKAALTKAKDRALSGQLVDVEEEHQALCKLSDEFAKAQEELDTVTKNEQESRAFYERHLLTKDEKDFKSLYEQKNALVKAQDEYNALCIEFDEIYNSRKGTPQAPLGEELIELTETLSKLRAEQNEVVSTIANLVEEANATPLQTVAIKAQASILQSEVIVLKSRHLKLKATVAQYDKAVSALLEEREKFNQDCNNKLKSVKKLFEKTKAQAKSYNLSDSELIDLSRQLGKAEQGVKYILGLYNSYPHKVWKSKMQSQLDFLTLIQSRLEEKIQIGNEAFRKSTIEIKNDIASLKNKINENTQLLKYLYTPEELADKVATVEKVCDKIELILKQVVQPQLKNLSKPIPLNLEPLQVIKQRLAEQNIAIDRAIVEAKALQRAAAAQAKALEAKRAIDEAKALEAKRAFDEAKATSPGLADIVSKIWRRRNASAELIEKANESNLKKTEQKQVLNTSDSSPKEPTPNNQSFSGNEPKVAVGEISPRSVAQTIEESTDTDTADSNSVDQDAFIAILKASYKREPQTAQSPSIIDRTPTIHPNSNDSENRIATKEKQEPQDIQVTAIETPPVQSDSPTAVDETHQLIGEIEEIKSEAPANSLEDNRSADPTTPDTDIEADNASTAKEHSKEVQIIRAMIDKIKTEIDRISKAPKNDETKDPRINILENMENRLNKNLGCYLLSTSITTPSDFIESSINSISEALRDGDSNYHSLTTEVSHSFINFINTLLRPLTWVVKTQNGENYRARFFPNETEVTIANAAEEAHKSLRQLQQERAEAEAAANESEEIQPSSAVNASAS